MFSGTHVLLGLRGTNPTLYFIKCYIKRIAILHRFAFYSLSIEIENTSDIFIILFFTYQAKNK